VDFAEVFADQRPLFRLHFPLSTRPSAALDRGAPDTMLHPGPAWPSSVGSVSPPDPHAGSTRSHPSSGSWRPIPPTAASMGGRAHLRSADAASAARAGSRALGEQRRNLDSCRNDASYASSIRLITNDSSVLGQAQNIGQSWSFQTGSQVSVSETIPHSRDPEVLLR
jgi:hypothetical protein